LNRLIHAALVVASMAALPPSGTLFRDSAATLPSLDPFVRLLGVHPVDQGFPVTEQPVVMTVPRVIRQGASAVPDPRQVSVPIVVTPSQPVGNGQQGDIIGKAGTGFFVGDDGTLLTAAHVVKQCSRMQIISKYVARTWVSLVGTDDVNDVAVLKATGLHPPSVVRVSGAPPVSGKLFILGYPESAGLTVPAETWAVMENEKFPASIGPLANPRDLLWMSAPAVTHGYSGGPIFDPKLGAVVGIVKGEVDGGYLRLVRDMPTTGIAIGPGVGRIGELMRHEVSYSAISLISSPGEAGEETLRRATVHVLCWR